MALMKLHGQGVVPHNADPRGLDRYSDLTVDKIDQHEQTNAPRVLTSTGGAGLMLCWSTGVVA